MEFIAQSRSVPDSVRQKLELRGMWDPCLIANAFDSADEFQAYVEHVSVVLVALYDACCKWTDARVSLAGRSCSNVQAVPLVPTPPVPLAPPLVACVPVVRPKRRASWLPRHPRRKAIPVPGLHSSAVVFRVYVDELWDKFIALGSDGALWHEFVALPVALQADYQALTKERLAKFSATTLSAALSALARWQDWQLRAGHVGPPTALAVSLWLRSLQDASNTSARGAFTSLRWLETHLGFSFATASPTVRAFREPVAGHVVKQAVPLTLIQWVQLEKVAQSSEGPTQLLVSVWLVMLLGLVRFAHLQRSSVTEPGASFSGVASVGKIRVRGVRRPVEWVASCLGLSGSLRACFHALFLHQGQDDRGAFLLPDLLEDSRGMLTLGSGPMSLTRFHALSRSLFASQVFGWAPVVVQHVTSYSARRVLPSVADMLCLSSSDRVSLGGWSASGSSLSSASSTAKRLRMPLRYSGVRAGAALVVRCYIVSVLTQVAKNGVWPDLAWDDIAQFFPHLVGKRLLPAPACPASSSLDSPAPVSLAACPSWSC